MMKWHSSIKPTLMKRTLFRGSGLGMLGIAFIIAAITYFYHQSDHFIGLVLFLSGLGAITLGLAPYKHLCQLENYPHSLELTEKELLYAHFGKLQLSIPLQSIKSLCYLENAKYGIGVNLHAKPTQKVYLLYARFKLENFLVKSAESTEGCTLFFPYFSHTSFLELKEQLEDHTF